LQAADMDSADASGALRGKPFQRTYPSSYVPQISRLRIRNPLTYGDSGWIELGRRTLIVGMRYGLPGAQPKGRTPRELTLIVGMRYGPALAGVLMPAAAPSGHLV